MLTKREVITLAVESTYNTSADPVATDALLVEDVSFSYEGANMAERAPIKATLGKEQSVFAGTLGQLQFTAEVKGSGVAGTAPEIGTALRCCGMAETVVASTSVTYDPASSGIESCTIDYYQDGRLRRLTGCRGTWEFTGNVGEIAKIAFTFTGHIAQESDTALIAPTYDAAVPAPMIAGAFDVGGYSAAISALSIALNNEIAMPKDLSSADGYGEIRIVDRDVSGSFDPEMVSIAANDFIGDWKAGNKRAITTGVIGTAAGNRFSLSIPEAYYREVSDADRDSLRTLDIGYGADGDDSAFSLQFT